jgi:hypothetical protein
MNNHNCKICDRSFRFKDLLDQHIPSCDFFSKSKKQHDRETELFEILPSPQDQYKLIQHLTLQVSKLQKEVETLKDSMLIKKRRLIIDWLHGPSNYIPTYSFVDWTKQIRVDQDHLQYVFQNGLAEGMKQSIHSHLESNMNAPIRAFTQKPGTLYLFVKDVASDTSSWRISTGEDLDRWMDRLSHRFLQEFIKWQIQNTDLINSSESEKEKNLEYMQKINGVGKQSEDRRKSEIKKWLYNQIEKNIETLAGNEYV